MDPRFVSVMDSLHSSFERLMAMPPISYERLPRDMPTHAVYLFSEQDRHLYAGRSSRLRKRAGEHCRPSSQHNQAVFAFRLAREATGRLVPAYVRGEGSRANLPREEAFNSAFTLAKARVRAMDFRYVEEADPTRQALLELYCAIVLGCPYNDFNTH
jgi:predicted GIY-YIG superfamily endonuclease